MISRVFVKRIVLLVYVQPQTESTARVVQCDFQLEARSGTASKSVRHSMLGAQILRESLIDLIKAMNIERTRRRMDINSRKSMCWFHSAIAIDEVIREIPIH